MVLYGDVEDELRSRSLFHEVEHVVVRLAVRGEAAQRLGALERGDVVERVEAQLAIHAVAPPVGGVGRVYGARGVAQGLEVRDQVLVAAQVVEHVGIHAVAEVSHARSREELELAVARPRAERRRVGGAPCERLLRQFVVVRGPCRRACEALEPRKVGKRLVHDGYDGGQHLVGALLRAVPTRAWRPAFANPPFVGAVSARACSRARFREQPFGFFGRVACGSLGGEVLDALEEAERRPLVGIRRARVPFPHDAMEVLADVAHVDPRPERRHQHDGHGRVRGHGAPGERRLGDEAQADAGGREQHTACDHALVGPERVPAAHGCRGVEREQVGRHDGLSLEGDDEMVRDTCEKADGQKRRDGPARALSDGVDDGEQGRQHPQVRGDVEEVHGEQHVVGRELHEEEAQRHGRHAGERAHQAGSGGMGARLGRGSAWSGLGRGGVVAGLGHGGIRFGLSRVGAVAGLERGGAVGSLDGHEGALSFRAAVMPGASLRRARAAFVGVGSQYSVSSPRTPWRPSRRCVPCAPAPRVGRLFLRVSHGPATVRLLRQAKRPSVAKICEKRHTVRANTLK